ncbi:MAG: glycosyltransferase family 2 protein [Candidatus Omnitrophica bacterium]|nr:glycosyltransferase family 2 protein [Candidatus Omnitrophota bacterium]MBU1047367.1 glycosyltransferase family 2 protein [Candidatus Omnitrophota bacterium]MBU1630869.1 glycosyltransferase family 2 protein [Candidatus Omnitrophota bacterium]MBU1766517.1 glycosyltransferase family 2 protein [Candidatus Omnitrophota bacterium]MBU1889048.1 glycosyltransferase family 2 protein [Candidatus Omnitrophota bacterium]
MKIGVVIPAYKVVKQISNVISSLPSIIEHIIVVDDKCPDSSGKEAEKINDNRIKILYRERNGGVGAAMITGYKKAIQLGCDIVIKIDGDGQMDPVYIDKLIAPIVNGEADYTKGNRFMNPNILKIMPKIRLIGNSVLSFWTKISSGYWNVMDPTNGYTAIRKEILENLELDKISKRYFFESDMLINLNLINAVVMDISMLPKYADENSSLNIWKAIIQFPPKLLKGFIKRLFLKYFIYDFNMASVYILIGVPIFFLGVMFGLIEWHDSVINNTMKPLGTIMLLTLSITLSFQMLLQAIHIDISLTPKRRIK